MIGAGALGLELAQALARLGVEITVFDRSDTIAGLRPGPVADSVLSVLRQEMKILLGTDITATRHNDAARIAWGGAEIGSGTFDRVLVATGRPPSTRDLDLQLAGLACDEHGVPCFDVRTMQCGQAPIFIAGDVDAYRPVLHEASTEGAIAGRNAARFPNVKSSERGISLSIMFTDPPLGVVGEPPHDESVVARAYYDDQGRAKVEAKNVGVIEVYADPVHGRLTGAVLAAPGGDHLAHLLAWAIERGETGSSLLEHPFYHPTYEEGIKDALRDICSAVHAPVPEDRDAGTPPGASGRPKSQGALESGGLGKPTA